MKDTRQHLRFYIPLAAGFLTMALLYPLPAGSVAAAFAAFLSPLCFLYAVRHASNKVQLFIAGAVFAFALTVMNLGYCYSFWLDCGVFLPSGAFIFAAFLIDRFHRPKERRFVTTLVFPLMWLTLFGLSQLIYLGFQFRLDAYATGFRALTGSAALIGSAGVLFLLLWTDSVAVYLIETKKSCSRVGVACFAVILAGLTAFGAVRNAREPAAEKSVRVAYTTGPYVGDYINFAELDYDVYADYAARKVAEAAESGAELVMFNEEAFLIPADRSDDFCMLLGGLAREYGIHILSGEEVRNTAIPNGKTVNRIRWFDRDGKLLFSYTKHSLVPVVESLSCAEGARELPALTVPFRAGDVKVAAFICYDSNFSAYVATIPPDTQLLLAPSWDWDSVTDYHGEVARLLAIENGVTLIKDTYDGASFVFSPTGKALAVTSTGRDGFETVHTVDVPVWERVTPAGRFGHLLGTVFGFLSSQAEADDDELLTSLPEGETDTMPTSTVIILSCDTMALIAMLILLYALIFENSEKDMKTLCFVLCCVCTILSLATDIPTWYFENKPGHDALLYTVNILSLVFSVGAVAAISFYEIEIIGRKEHVSGIHAILIVTVCAIAATVATFGVFIGKTFTIRDGVFTYGPWYSVIPTVAVAMLFYMGVLAVVKSRYLGRHRTLAFLSYMFLPLTSIAIEVFYPQVSLALAATSLSALLLYVMLQSGHVSALHMRGDLLNELSYKDMLTGLQNRRAYDEALGRLTKEPLLNVIFCDVNGLKYMNDTFGHGAGDERLKQFTELVRRHFSDDSIFHISGDEFVLLIPKLPPSAFNERFGELREDISRHDDIASIGAASGTGTDKHRLLTIAEDRMYEDKKLCRVRHPEFNR